MNTVLLIGLPCSGKSTFAQKLNNHNIYEIIDDFNEPLTIKEKLEISAKNQTNLIICDINFCIFEIREKAKNLLWKCGYTKITELYFENNVDKCLNNLIYRNGLGDSRAVQNAINLYSQHYSIPEDALVLKIWQNNNNNNNLNL
jgi:hypothetical protein